MKQVVFLIPAGCLAACTSSQAYGPASKSGALGYASQKIEAGRYQVTYTDTDPARARDRALLRAAELTLLEGSDWFEITSSYTDRESGSTGSRSSVSIGGSSSVGVGVGIGFPLGGGSGGEVTEMIEIVTGTGEKPDRPMVYDAQSVDINLRGAATQ